MFSAKNTANQNAFLNKDNVTKVTLEIMDFQNVTNHKSISFTLQNNDKIKLDLNCQTNYRNASYFGYTYAMIYLYLSNSVKEHFNVRYRLSILNANGDKCEVKEGANKFSKNDSGQYGGYFMILRDFILKQENGLLVNGKLTICCEIEEIETISNTIAIGSKAQKTDFSSLSQDYETLLESGKLSDAVLVVGKKVLHVHKIVLSARSPVFAAMFQNSSTKEAQENRVEITDVNVEVMEEMLKYIYTGKVESLDQLAADLMIAADKYQLDSLKSICEQFLCTVITTESVADLFLLSDLHQAKDLTARCCEFISDNGTEVMSSEGWKKILVKPDLISKLFERMSLKITGFKNKSK